MSFSPRPYNTYIWKGASGKSTDNEIAYVTCYIAFSNIIFTPTGFVINADYSIGQEGAMSDLTLDSLLYFVSINDVSVSPSSGDWYKRVYTYDVSTITKIRVYMYISSSAYLLSGPVRYYAAAMIDTTISGIQIKNAVDQYTIMKTASPISGGNLSKVCFITLPPAPVTGQLVTIKSAEGNVTYVYSNTKTIDDSAYNTNVAGVSCVVLTSKNAVTLLFDDMGGWQIVGFVGSS